MEAERSYKSKAKGASKFQPEQKPKIKYENLPRLPHDRALQAHQQAIDRGARCEECPLFGLRAGPVMGDNVTRRSRLTIIGEAPGAQEVEGKRVFCGRSGDILDSSLLDGGVAREDCSITNTLLCRPPEEMKAFEFRLKLMHEAAKLRAEEQGLPAPPEPKTPYDCCFPRLERDVKESASQTVLAVGGAALRAVADIWNVAYGNTGRKLKTGEIRIASLKKQIGSPITMPDGTIVVATYHPAFAMRPGSRHYMHIVKTFITRAAEISRRGRIDWAEPEFILNPSVEMIESVLASMKGKWKAIDIETDKGTRPDGKFDPFSCRIRCIGFGAYLNNGVATTTGLGEEVVICVPIRHMSGAEWWPDKEDKRRVVQACLNALNDESIDEVTGEQARLVGHNLAFDTGVLLRFKLLARRDMLFEDTILMHHDTQDNDLPHDLGFVGARYFEVPAWKSGADDKYYDNVTDLDMHTYNARDVLATMRLYPRLLDDIYRYGTIDQYELDRRLAPVARDMGELGLFVDERKRGELSLRMNQESYSRLLKLKEIVKNPKFNPSSAPQIRRFLFGEKKHMPIINTQGKDWEEGEDPSTNTIALTKLVAQQGCDQQTKDFINTLLEYRAYMKLKSTYIDKLKVHYPDWKKEFGIDMPILPEVRGPVWVEYTKWRRTPKDSDPIDWVPPPSKQDVAEQRWPDEWARAFAPVPKTLSKDDARVARAVRKLQCEEILARVEEGEWQDAVVIPERPALSRLHTTYKLHVVPSGRMSASPNCFDDQTEILTNRGWLLFRKLTKSDLVAQYELTDECISFVRPTNYFDMKSPGKLVYTTGSYLDIACTEDHQFVGRTRHAHRYLEWAAATWPTSKDIQLPQAGFLAQPGGQLSKAEIQLLCAAQADGYVNINHQWEFSFTKQRKIKRLRACLQELGYAFNERPKKNGIYKQTRITVTDLRIVWLDEYLTRTRKAAKQPELKLFNQERLLKLDPSVLSAMRDEVMHWDGCITRNSHYSCSDKPNSDFVQALHVLTGLPAKVRSYSNQRTTRPNWQVDRRSTRWMGNSVTHETRSYTGRVYCVSVPSGMIIVRRNGKVAITKNCQNWPKFGKANMHEMIVAPPGHVMVGADLDQVELRLYAAIAGDKILIDAFTKLGPDGKPYDPHSLNAASLFAKKFGKSITETYLYIMGLPDMHAGLYGKAAVKQARLDGTETTLTEADVTPALVTRMNKSAKAHTDTSGNVNTLAASKELQLPEYLIKAMLTGAKKGDKEKKKLRGYAKTFAYLECYGGEADKLFSFMSTARDKGTGALMFPDLKEEDVQEWHREWHTHHPETRAWQDACQRAARREGFTSAPIGSHRKRFFPNGANKPGATFNHVIQGASAEIANAALLKIAAQIPYLKWSPFTGVCLQIHDYIGAYVPTEYAEEAKRIIEEALNGEVNDGIKITASAVISDGLATQ